MARPGLPAPIAHLAISAYEMPGVSPNFDLIMTAMRSSSISFWPTLYKALFFN